MAKKKKKSTKKRRRSGLSGVNNTILETLAIVAGAVGAGFINKVIPATVNDKMVSGGKVAIGVALNKFAKGSNAGIMRGIGNGFIAVGSVDLLKSFGVLSGDFDFPNMGEDVLGADDIDVINGLGENEDEMGEDVLGADDIAVINGEDDE
jgi:hypothetical protein